jgi:hypothetical protein
LEVRGGWWSVVAPAARVVVVVMVVVVVVAVVGRCRKRVNGKVDQVVVVTTGVLRPRLGFQ